MFDSALLEALTRDPGFDGEGREMAIAVATVGLAAGPALQHDLLLIPPLEPCAAARRRLERGWIVLQLSPRTPTGDRLKGCLRDVAPVHADPVYALYGITR